MIVVSSWSRPLVRAAVITLFIGTSIGTIYMLFLSGMIIYDADITTILANIFNKTLHRELQSTAITLFIMGVMYMIVPRIRGIRFEHVLEVKVSFILMVVSIFIFVFTYYTSYYYAITYLIRLTALAVFTYVISKMLKVAPRTGKISDYYFIISLMMLITYNIILALNYGMDSLNMIYIWLASVIYVIFGIQYRVAPVFFGKAAPIKGLDTLAFVLASTSALLLIVQMQFYAYTLLLIDSIIFAYSIYIMHPYKIPELLYTTEDPQSSEKISRLKFFVPLIRISYIMLILGLLTALLYYLMPNFALYDLAIHLVTIGFIGITLMNFMPIMLPPIIGRNINYTRFNMQPLALLMAGIVIRVVWNILPLITQVNRLILGVSGFIVLASMILYVRMIHLSMEPMALNQGSINSKQ